MTADGTDGWRPPVDASGNGGAWRGLARTVAAPLLGWLRARDGRAVAWTPPRLGGGNHLYMWMWAHSERALGRQAWVLERAGMDAWIAMFPLLRELTIPRAEVPLLSQRLEIWNQNYDGFEREHLDDFIAHRLLPSPTFTDLRDEVRRHGGGGPSPVTVNVRRGDYYTVPEHAQRYSMDLRAYLREAFAMLEETGGPDGARRPVTVVSDDPGWCLAHLPRWFPALDVTSWEGPTGIFADLARLASAETLILTNSTFSYWGGYLSEHLRAAQGTPARIIAPTFHVRGIGDGSAWQLSPTWQRVDNAEAEVMRVPAVMAADH